MTFVESIEDSRGESHDVVAQPISEQDLVKALTEQAHKIATTVLEQPGTGEDLINDAQVCIVHCEKCYTKSHLCLPHRFFLLFLLFCSS